MRVKHYSPWLLFVVVLNACAGQADNSGNVTNVCSDQQFSEAKQLFDTGASEYVQGHIAKAVELFQQAEQRCAIAGIQLKLAALYLKQQQWDTAYQVLARVQQSGQILNESQQMEYNGRMAEYYLGLHQANVARRHTDSYPIPSLCPQNDRFPQATPEGCGLLPQALTQWLQAEHYRGEKPQPTWMANLDKKLQEAKQDYSWNQTDLDMQYRSMRSAALEEFPDLPIHFDTAAWSLNGSAQQELGNLKNFLQKRLKTEKFSVQLRGHADQRGTDSYNKELSRKRVMTVAALLSELGVEIDGKALGELDLLCEKNDEECWKKNRRVDYRLLPQ